MRLFDKSGKWNFEHDWKSGKWLSLYKNYIVNLLEIYKNVYYFPFDDAKCWMQKLASTNQIHVHREENISSFGTQNLVFLLNNYNDF